MIRELLAKTRKLLGSERTEFHQTIFLRQPPRLSRAILWTIMISTALIVIWSIVARIDEVVLATGKLEPRGSVQEIQAPESGVITEILVKEGERVEAGQALVRMDVKAAQASVDSLRERLEMLNAELDFYQNLPGDSVAAVPPTLVEKIPEEVAALANDRAALLADNRLLEAEMHFSDEGIDLDANQKRLFKTVEEDRRQRLKKATLASESAEKQLAAINSQYDFTAKLVENSRTVLQSYSKLTKNGGVAQVDYLAREGEFIRNQTQLQSLLDGMVRLRLEISRAQEEESNVTTAFLKEAMSRYSENTKQIAEIDTRISKMKLEVGQQISQIEAQLTASEVQLGYLVISAPAAGIIFDVNFKKSGAVVKGSEVLLKIVPGGELIATVDIPNKDIGFIHQGMPCEVRIDSFPYREFGQIEGKLAFIGSDALPPTQIRPTYAFPAKVDLDRQFLGVEPHRLNLQSGMSVSVNIHIRTRNVMSLFLDFLMGPLDRLEEVR